MAESRRVADLDLVENNTRENQKKCRPSIVPSRHVLHQLQLVGVDAGQASDVISTLKRQGFSPQFMEAETAHGSK